EVIRSARPIDEANGRAHAFVAPREGQAARVRPADLAVDLEMSDAIPELVVVEVRILVHLDDRAAVGEIDRRVLSGAVSSAEIPHGRPRARFYVRGAIELLLERADKLVVQRREVALGEGFVIADPVLEIEDQGDRRVVLVLVRPGLDQPEPIVNRVARRVATT